MSADALLSDDVVHHTVNVRDIRCPTCGDSDPVQKEGIGDYRCVNCDVTFGPPDR